MKKIFKNIFILKLISFHTIKKSFILFFLCNLIASYGSLSQLFIGNQSGSNDSEDILKLNNLSSPSLLFSATEGLRQGGNTQVAKNFAHYTYLPWVGTLAMWHGMSEGFDKISSWYDIYFGNNRAGRGRRVPQVKQNPSLLRAVIKHITIIGLIIAFKDHLLFDPTNLLTQGASVSSNLADVSDTVKSIIEKSISTYYGSLPILPSEDDQKKIIRFFSQASNQIKQVARQKIGNNIRRDNTYQKQLNLALGIV
jgi:hypothetical protein